MNDLLFKLIRRSILKLTPEQISTLTRDLGFPGEPTPEFQINDVVVYTYIPRPTDDPHSYPTYQKLSGHEVIIIDIDTESPDGTIRYSVALPEDDTDFFTAFEEELAYPSETV